MPNRKANYRVSIKYPQEQPNYPYIPSPEPNGIHYGIQFHNGHALVKWEELGEDVAYDTIQQMGSDGRFFITEVTTTSP
jgi:hypothetical protein